MHNSSSNRKFYKEVAIIYQTVANVLKVSISIRTNKQNLLRLSCLVRMLAKSIE